MRKLILLQRLLCCLLLFVSVVLAYRSNRKTVQAGVFGVTETSNDTFEDLSISLFGELFNE